MNIAPTKLLLADDDTDDCFLFREALNEISANTILTIASDGAELMDLLTSDAVLPAAVFLDLNMPRKNGFECLREIKQNEKLKALPVIIYSTSFDKDVIKLLYNQGALCYIRKPADFLKITEVIEYALQLISQTNKPANLNRQLYTSSLNTIIDECKGDRTYESFSHGRR